MKAVADGSGFTIRRNLYVGEIVYMPADYSDLKAFYSQFEAKDQEPVIVKIGASAQAATSSSPSVPTALATPAAQSQNP